MFNKSIKICLIHLVERERFPLVEFYFRKNPIVKKRINIRHTQIYFNNLSFL